MLLSQIQTTFLEDKPSAAIKSSPTINHQLQNMQ
jgi:hypothetical protein